MSWEELSIVRQRNEFCIFASKEHRNIRELCKRYKISPTTGYKWIKRFQREGEIGLHNQSKKPKSHPNRTSKKMENKVIQVREKYPYWGGRKLKRILEKKGITDVPSASTITQILKRNNCLNPEESDIQKDCQRFEYKNPNDLWQMDFKGKFKTEKEVCHALTVLDDHSRFSVTLEAKENEKHESVQEALTETFQLYGLPRRMLMDNGSCWGGIDGDGSYFTKLTVWLLDLRITVIHGRPYHPQTQGKEERFHRTLNREVIKRQLFADLSSVQKSFDKWREQYNTIRPHEALGMEVPSSRYHPSSHKYPSQISPPEYDQADIVRTVVDGGRVKFEGQVFRVGKAFKTKPVAIRPNPANDGLYDVFYRHQKIREIDLKSKDT